MKRVINVFISLIISLITAPIILVIIVIVTFSILNATGRITKIGRDFMNNHIEGKMYFDSLHFEFDKFPLITVQAKNGYLVSYLKQNNGDTLASFDFLRASINPFMIMTDNMVFIPNVYLISPYAKVQMTKDKRPGWALWRFKKKKNEVFKKKKSKTELNIKYVNIIGPAHFDYINYHNKVEMHASGDSLFFNGRIAIDYRKIFPQSFCLTNLHYQIFNGVNNLKLYTNADSIFIEKINNNPYKNVRLYISTFNDSINIKKLKINYPSNIKIKGTVSIGPNFRNFSISSFNITTNEADFLLNGNVTKITKGLPYETDVNFLSIGSNPLKLISLFFPAEKYLNNSESYLPYYMHLRVSGNVSQSLNLKPTINLMSYIKNGSFRYKNLPVFNNINAKIHADFPSKGNTDGKMITQIKVNLINSDFLINADVDFNKSKVVLNSQIKSFLELANFSPFLNKYKIKTNGKADVNFKLYNLLFDAQKRSISPSIIHTSIKGDSLQLNFDNRFISLSNSLIDIERIKNGETTLKIDANNLDVKIDSSRIKTLGVKNMIRFNINDSIINSFLKKANVSQKLSDDMLEGDYPFRFQFKSYVNKLILYEKGAVLSLDNQDISLDALLYFGKKSFLRWFDISLNSHDFYLYNNGLKVVAGQFDFSFNSTFLNNNSIGLNTHKKFFINQLLYDALLKSNIVLKQGSIINQGFNLPTLFDSLNFSIYKDDIKINSLKAQIGESNISLNGFINGLTSDFNDSTKIKSEINLSAEHINLNQLIPKLTEYRLRKRYNDSISNRLSKKIFPPKLYPNKNKEDDDKSILPLLSSNLDLKLNFDAKNLIYENDTLNHGVGSLFIVDKTLLLDDFNFQTDLGFINVFAKYKELGNNKATTSIVLKIKNLDVNKAINLFPDIENVAPPIKTINGNINAKIIAMADLDSTFLLEIPSLAAVSIVKCDTLSILKKKLMPKLLGNILFHNQKEISLFDLTLQASLKDEILSIYPFLADFKRFVFFANGVMDINSKFFYHIGVIKWLLPFRVGIDVYGVPKSKIKFRLTPITKINLNFPAKYLTVSPNKLYPYNNLNDEYSNQYLRLMIKYNDIISKYKTDKLRMQSNQ
ncbi:MAG: hypothetical protein Q4F97_02070 [Bacteroidales bacterium]|nr:hypothetical protein [Bacteroidales bacterium]